VRSYVTCHENIALIILLKYVQHKKHSLERTRTVQR